MKARNILILLISLAFLLLIIPGAVGLANAGGGSAHLEGNLTIIWGDPSFGSGQIVDPVYYLTDQAGNSVELQFSEKSALQMDLLRMNRQVVQVDGSWLPVAVRGEPRSILVEQIQLKDRLVAPRVDGPQPWVSLMCKFADIPDEPRDLAYFQNMYGSTYPGLDHYWREQSYDLINMNGAGAVGWYTLPDPRSEYFDGDGNLLWGKAANDCTAVADADVYFPDFVGINLMFNAVLDCCAWGGAWPLTLDGESRYWYVTWEPPWGYADIAVIEHEMGHGFGLPHSSGDYGQVYDNRWDVMSSLWYNNLIDPTYGILGQHTISYHKDILDWIDAAEKFLAPQDSLTTIPMEQLALPQTTNFKIAQIPINGSSTHFYTVEVRRLVGYDAALPGSAVIIHEVDEYRNEPAHVVDIDGNGNTGDAGAMWTVGEIFSDPEHEIYVMIDAQMPTGYTVTIQLGNPVAPPGEFDKISPTNGATDQSLDVTLEWQSSMEATSYEYCYDTSDDDACSNWISNSANISTTLSGLAEGTTYYWQVRALNTGGTVYANGSENAFWSFTTIVPPPPGEFDKAIPADGAIDQPLDVALEWQSSAGATSYEYCYDLTDDDACSIWIENGANLSTTLTGLAEGSAYYWQVRALNIGGTVYANGSETAFWSFTTTINLPEPFSKTLPIDGAMDQSTEITLSWEDSAGASGYEYCYDSSDDDTCSNWISSGTNVSVTLSSLEADIAYFWQVRALNDGGTVYANGGETAFWAFTTKSNLYPIFLPMVLR